MGKRIKTKSKNFYDDEVLFVDEEGTHLKIGVKRLDYNTDLDYNNWRGQLNLIDSDGVDLSVDYDNE